jgi:hypothetical protein
MTRPPEQGRELAALVGGPLDRWWYWRDDLEAAQRTAERMAAPPPPVPRQSAGALSQRRCGRADCNAWRLSRPGTDGTDWRPCWKCRTGDVPTGDPYDPAASQAAAPAGYRAPCLDYRPTEQWVDNRLPAYGAGRVWTYTPTRETPR